MASARELLGQAPIFAAMDAAQVDQLAAIARPQSFAAGELVVTEGEPGLHLFLVVKGRLAAETVDGDKTAALSIMGPGEVFGEVAMLDGLPRSASVRALEACELLVIGRNEFLHFLERSPKASIALLTVLARRLRHLSQRVGDRLAEVPVRLARQLLRLADAHGVQEPSGTVIIDLKLSQADLGELVGATRETVNKLVRSWTDDGLLERRGRRLAVADRSRLEALGRGEGT